MMSYGNDQKTGLTKSLPSKFDKRDHRFERHVRAKDPLQVIIRGHLYIEAELGDLLREAVCIVVPDAINLDDWAFGKLLELATALGLLSVADAGAYRAINKLRNRIAHDLDFAIDQSHARDVYNSLSPFFRRLFGPAPKSFSKAAEIIGTCLMVMFVHLNSARKEQHNLRIQMQRDHEKVEELRKTVEPLLATLEAKTRKTVPRD